MKTIDLTNFNKEQIEVLNEASNWDGKFTQLTEDMISYIANPEFDAHQMYDLFIGFRFGASLALVQKFINPHFDEERRGQGFTDKKSKITLVCQAIQEGLSEEQISSIANPSLSESEMSLRIRAYKANMSVETINEYLKSMNINQAFVIVEAIEEGVSDEQLSVIANPAFDYLQMWTILQGFLTPLEHEQVLSYAKEYFGNGEMLEILKGYQNGLTEEQVSLYAKKQYKFHQMEAWREALERGIAVEEIEKYSHLNGAKMIKALKLG